MDVIRDIQIKDSQTGSAIYADWAQLSAKQQEDIQALHDRINDHLIAETEAFNKQHPELKVGWKFTISCRVPA
jgi:hypothetical protein